MDTHRERVIELLQQVEPLMIKHRGMRIASLLKVAFGVEAEIPLLRLGWADRNIIIDARNALHATLGCCTDPAAWMYQATDLDIATLITNAINHARDAHPAQVTA